MLLSFRSNPHPSRTLAVKDLTVTQLETLIRKAVRDELDSKVDPLVQQAEALYGHQKQQHDKNTQREHIIPIVQQSEVQPLQFLAPFFCDSFYEYPTLTFADFSQEKLLQLVQHNNRRIPLGIYAFRSNTDRHMEKIETHLLQQVAQYFGINLFILYVLQSCVNMFLRQLNYCRSTTSKKRTAIPCRDW